MEAWLIVAWLDTRGCPSWLNTPFMFGSDVAASHTTPLRTKEKPAITIALAKHSRLDLVGVIYLLPKVYKSADF
jgi:hypothetical protein